MESMSLECITFIIVNNIYYNVYHTERYITNSESIDYKQSGPHCRLKQHSKLFSP